MESQHLGSVSLSNPLLAANLPGWVSELRPHQVTAVEAIMDAYSRVPVVVLDAPTGAGKSLIGEMTRLLLGEKAVYLCTTKSLQSQVVTDFPNYCSVWGRANYPTETGGKSITCEDCTFVPATNARKGVAGRAVPCLWCSSRSVCPYVVAKQSALGNSAAVLNSAYYLTEVNHVGMFANDQGIRRGREPQRDDYKPFNFVILDEADTLEGQLMGQVEVELPTARLNKYGWNPPRYVTKSEAWLEWLTEYLPKINTMGTSLARQPHSRDIKIQREIRYLAALYNKLSVIDNDLERSPDEWAYTGTDKRSDYPRVSWRPVFVNHHGHELFWQHADRHLLMSATIVDPAELIEATGGPSSYEVVHVPSTFPVENRRIFPIPVANMTHAAADEEWPKMAEACTLLAENHPDERILIHTVSYKLASYLADHLSLTTARHVCTYTAARDRDDALANYLATKASIFVAPSMDRGYDFPDDAARVQILVKCPFPNLGDRQIKQRLSATGGQTWYTLQTARAIVQMTGRSIRSKDDWCVTYILDKQFYSNVWNRARHLFPPWWTEAVNWWPPANLANLSNPA